ncbi:hypothetical protein QEH48_gp094 [Streptomyces phage TurkishDelight]|uniref:Uncharacterized protein n=2 Tax=root TaxID=1 RepID=A0A7T0Q3Q4_9CAUD|nr:hypothetical protein QEH48_gp094 [Streptomyces phage TurkishDelight]QPL14123.1 hypothetical protein SEA_TURKISHDELIGHT_94 [Streptomyces phage TurkishDelight]
MTPQQERVADLLRQCREDYKGAAAARERARVQAREKAARAGATEAGEAR